MLWFGHLVCTWLYFGTWTLWSIAPDVPMLMFVTGNQSWKETRETHLYSLLYRIPHSLLSVVFVPREYRRIYAFHIFLDILSHTGEWSIQPFYPCKLRIHGIWDPIDWD